MKFLTIGLPAVVALGLCAGAVSATRAQSTPTYSIDWHLISSGGATGFDGAARSACFIVTGTIGQAAAGFSGGGAYAIYAGFWEPDVGASSDEISFNGFEDCTP